MTHKTFSAGKITFGTILLTLLVLGTFVVGGLMYTLYRELTETPEKTANWHEQQQKQQIEVMSPDGKPGERVYRAPGQPAAASVPTAATTAPPAAQTGTAASAPPPSALEGEAAPKIPTAKKPQAKKPTAATDIPAEQPLRPEPAPHTTAGEVPLRPTNTAPRDSGEQRERPLKPLPSGGQKGSGDAIEELF